MRIGLIATYADDLDQAQRFYTETLGFQVKITAAYGSERWSSVVSPEEPDGLELTLHLADEAAREFQATQRQIGRPVFALHTDDCHGEAIGSRLRASNFSRSPRGCPTAAV
jgi:catechol 2,3-dioxygenase-like lactoylglutathione lyase family enzyme